MSGENSNDQGNDDGGDQVDGGNPGDGGNNEPIKIPEQSPFTNPGQVTTRTEKPFKPPLNPNGDD